MLGKVLIVAGVGAGLLGLTVAWASPRPQAPPEATPAAAVPKHAAESRDLEPGSVCVRLLLGVGDEATTRWDGRLALDEGEVLGVEPWRFRAGDEVTGADAWRAGSLPIRRTPEKKAAGKAAAKKKAIRRAEEKGGPSNTGPGLTPTGIVARLKARATATLVLTTTNGEARIPLSDLAGDEPRRYLGGRVEARLVPPHAPLVTREEQEDFPAAVSDGKAGAWVAYVAHSPRGSDASEALTAAPESFRAFVPEGGGDQLKLLHFDGRRVDREVDITGPGRDLWRPAITTAGPKIVVVWPEQVEGNWDLHACFFDPAGGEPQVERLTTDPGTDTDPAIVTAVDGTTYVAWQGWRDGQADILLASTLEPQKVRNLSDHPANDWHPSIALDPAGHFHVAFDSYRNGNYDVLLYTNPRNGPEEVVTVADSARFEARPSLAIDRQSRYWIAYEERPENWGKDFGSIPDDPGTGLYQQSAVRVRCVDGGKVLDGGDPVAAAPEAERGMNAFARIAVDRDWRPHLLYRHRQEAIWGNNAVMVVGAVWVEQATTLVGGRWTPPRPLPRSDNMLDNRPALVAPPEGPAALLAFYSTDGRLHREVEQTPDLWRRFYTHSGTPAGVVNNDLFVAALAAPPDGSADPQPGGPPAAIEAVARAHPGEADAAARLRTHRIETGGKTYQLLRGEFHRHTEISQDGGNDGALEDMWRYALDAARFDWIGNGDHDNGGGKEYTWWLVQKTTDLYHVPPAFVPMFTYERSVSYPGGHRNVMFPRRGIRTLPRLVDDTGVQTNVNGRDLDAAMLYRYLNELGGICASHTSGTGMGTDWRANDPKAEPFVEIYQGVRNSYEHFGAPRVAHGPGDAIGGWRPLGMVWNALAMQYKVGFQSSSDHVSTHISLAIAIAEAPTREAIFDAFRRRHCYAATDNILLDVRSGDHLMGDEFEAAGPVTLKIQAHGTAPIAKLDIIKDFHYVYSTEPGRPDVAFEWTDEDPLNRNPSWYYVRVLQADGQIAWGSPMWVTRPAQAR